MTGNGPEPTPAVSSASCSVLFPGSDPPEAGPATEPVHFTDLNLDQVVAAITAGREAYNLEPLFYSPLGDIAAITYRHDVFRDLEDGHTASAVKAFTDSMRAVRNTLDRADSLHYRFQRDRWHLDAVENYCAAVIRLAGGLAAADLSSEGLRALGDYVAAYVSSDGFTELRDETGALKSELAGVTYTMRISDNRIKVAPYDGEDDYSAQIERTFEKFKRGSARDYRVRIPNLAEMNHVEAEILDLVAELFPEPFAALEDFCQHRRRFIDETVGRFDREVQFYLSYRDFVARLRNAGLPFCYPEVTGESNHFSAKETYDIALAAKLVSDGTQMVCNDFYLAGEERIVVVTGPNQGGKTTLARAFGQLHYLAALGCPLPGKAVKVMLRDEIFTHFERDEDAGDLTGRLREELVRIHEILDRATDKSIIVMNETFASTTLEDAVRLGSAVIEQITDIGALCAYVTFVDELASASEATVSMVSTVVADNPAQRTYRLVRKPADGLAYAAAIAQRYGLTYDSLRRRMSA